MWRISGCSISEGRRKIVKRSLEAGVNFIDTADVYSGPIGDSVGQALKNLGVARKDVIIATKVLGAVGPGPNDRGSRAGISWTVAASLKRLSLDYIDLYQVHGFDPVTPLEETLGALDDVVRRGMVRSIGCSNFAAWQIAKALGVSDKRGYARFESLQAYYSIAGRDLEREIVPLVEDEQLGIMAWSPLAGGLLSGKYTRSAAPTEGAPRRVRLSAGR